MLWTKILEKSIPSVNGGGNYVLKIKGETEGLTEKNDLKRVSK